MVAGAAAFGAILYMNHQRPPWAPPSTECSARRATLDDADAVSARQATLPASEDDAAADSPTAASADPLSELFPQVSDEFHGQFEQVGKVPRGGDQQAAVRARDDILRRAYSNPTHTKTLGAKVLIAGRCGEERKAAAPKVRGGCMFFQTEAYADTLQEQGVSEDPFEVVTGSAE